MARNAAGDAKETGAGRSTARPPERDAEDQCRRRRLCATMKVLPAIVILAVRGWFVGFAATEYATVPLPVAVAPFVTVIQDALLVAVHEHVLSDAVTVTVPVAAADVKF